jgi:hypothetical protein
MDELVTGSGSGKQRKTSSPSSDLSPRDIVRHR